MPTVSIIVPVYNAEKYLRECIESIVGQSYADFELILVDDGAKDSSPAICDEYAEKHKNIQVIHKVNEGVSIARKTGVDNAAGRYIMFVDSDDWLDKDCLKQIAFKMQYYNSDILVFNAIREFSNGKKQAMDMKYTGYYDKEKIRQEIFSVLIHSKNVEYYRPALWGNLFKREIIIPYMLADSRATVGEDSACLIPAIYHADSMYFCSEEFYHYRINLSSATNSHRAFNWDNPEVVADHILGNIDIERYDFKEQLDRRICHDIFNVCLSNAYGYSNVKDYVSRVSKELNREEYRDSIRRAAYKGNLMADLMQVTLRNRWYGLIYLYSRFK